MLRPRPYFHSSSLRRLFLSSGLPQGYKTASPAPAITFVYQRRRKKEEEKCICLILSIYSNSYRFSAFLLFHLLCVSRLACVGSISDLLALGFLMGPTNRDPWEEIRIWEKNELRIFFSPDSFPTVTSGWLHLSTYSRGSLLYPTLSLPVQK